MKVFSKKLLTNIEWIWLKIYKTLKTPHQNTAKVYCADTYTYRLYLHIFKKRWGLWLEIKERNSPWRYERDELHEFQRDHKMVTLQDKWIENSSVYLQAKESRVRTIYKVHEIGMFVAHWRLESSLRPLNWCKFCKTITNLIHFHLSALSSNCTIAY